MKLQKVKPLNQSLQNQRYVSETVKKADSHALTKRLLEELQAALYWQKQTLAEAAAEIEQLLKEFEQDNPTATEAEKQAFITSAIAPTRRERFLDALQAGWKEMFKEFLAHPYLDLGIATLERWQKAE